MPFQVVDTREPVTPTTAETELARESSRSLAEHLEAGGEVRLQVVAAEGSGEAFAVPLAAVRLLVHILTEMGQGNAVTLMPIHMELTTQQAADLLNVSRPYLIKILDEGKVPHRSVGKDHLVRFDDLMAFKRKDDAYRARVADQLVADAQELGLGY
jgi:excisionase family DNA binding protein